MQCFCPLRVSIIFLLQFQMSVSTSHTSKRVCKPTLKHAALSHSAGPAKKQKKSPLMSSSSGSGEPTVRNDSNSTGPDCSWLGPPAMLADIHREMVSLRDHVKHLKSKEPSTSHQPASSAMSLPVVCTGSETLVISSGQNSLSTSTNLPDPVFSSPH